MRRWQVLLIRVVVNLGVALVAGSALPLERPLYVHGDTTEPSRHINAVLFFVVTFEGLIALTVLPLFAEERELFAHERKAKLYRILPYFIANLFAELLVQSYTSLIFGATFYVIVDISHDFHRLVFYLVATVLIGECASAFAQLCSSASRSITNSLALCAMGLGSFLLFSGFLVLPGSIPSFFTPLYHASFWKYGFQALTINQYDGAQFPCESLNYSVFSGCPPFGFDNDCPIFPCTNKTSGHAAKLVEYRRFNDRAEVHNSFLTSGLVGMFLGSADARQVNCRLLCGPEEAPGRYEGDDCVCASFAGCRNNSDTMWGTNGGCPETIWKDAMNNCKGTRALNGVFANGTCDAEVPSVTGEYFLDTLGFGRLDAENKPAPENDSDLSGARTFFVKSPVVTKYVWLGALLVINLAFRILNFALILFKRD